MISKAAVALGRYKLLVVCKSNCIVGSIHSHFTKWGYDVFSTSSDQSSIEELEFRNPDIIIFDVGEDDSGLDTLARLHAIRRDVPIIAMSSRATIGMAVKATKLGAENFVSNPPDLFQLRSKVDQALAEKRELTHGGERSNAALNNFGILGKSQAICDVLDLVRDVAETDATVLILGESGTGKELLARATHECSKRADARFVPVNVAALPATLSESILFGHEKGSYTGADRSSAGWCETADGGTLMLDEIGEMDIHLQAKLLRFLQDGTFMRVGSNTVKNADVRIIAATNREPQSMVDSGTMREDLFYRLNVFPIRMPSLSERREDIPILAQAFLERSAETHRRPVVGFAKEVIESLVAYDWPGNVRQLENLVTRMVLLTRDPCIGLQSLPDEIRRIGFAKSSAPDASLSQMEDLEKRAIIQALSDTQGNAVAAAKLLGLGQATIYRKIKRFDIEIKKLKTLAKASS